MSDQKQVSTGSTDGATTSEPKAEKPDPVDDLVITQHTLRTRAGELAYTARTGRVVLREEEVEDDVFKGWKARAEMSVTAYTLKDADLTTRPITFVFNGGPGSSSIWLHMGLLGPRRVDLGDVTATHPPPYRLVDNPETLLAVSDLVFIDPMSTGHTRAVEGGKPKDFHGFGKDVEQVTELIRLWCTREDRWMSPKYVVGESYGTVRAVAVAERLSTRHSMGLNGIVLISSVLDFGSQDFEFHRVDEACLNFLPTYTSIAHFHGKAQGPARQAAAGGRGLRRRSLPDGARRRAPPPAQGARERRADAGPADRPLGGVRRPHRPAGRALALLHRAAARPRPDGGTDRRPLQRPAALPDRREHGRRPVDGRDGGAVHRGVAPLPAQRARQHPRPVLRGVRRAPSRSGRSRSSRASRSSWPTSWSG